MTARPRGLLALGVLCLGATLLPASPASAKTAPTAPDAAATTRAAVAPPPTVSATSYVVADADSGAVLAARAPHRPLPPASTLKALTALAVHPGLAPGTVYTATEDDERVEGSKAGMVEGGTYTARQLFLAMFLRSGNDAAHGLAELHGGVEATIADMNAEAERLQARNTTARTVEGLDAPGQTSSAYDLALIGRAVLAQPELVDYATTVTARFPGRMPKAGAKRAGFALWSQQDYVINYDGALGIKNGYTTQARNTMVAAAERDGHRVVVTLMGAGAGAWREAAALSDWYFSGGRRATPVAQLVDPLPPVEALALGAVEPAADSAPLAAAVAAAAVASTGPEGDGLLGRLAGWLLRTLAVLLALVVALRARVLVRRRLRARRRAAARVPTQLVVLPDTAAARAARVSPPSQSVRSPRPPQSQPAERLRPRTARSSTRPSTPSKA